MDGGGWVFGCDLGWVVHLFENKTNSAQKTVAGARLSLAILISQSIVS